MARISLDELRTRASTVDRAKLDATTEADIKAQQAADGDADLDVPQNVQVAEPPRALRVRLGLTQPEMAAALNIPVGTWRNWEQGRTTLEPAALALLRIVSRNPAIALASLSSEISEEGILPKDLSGTVYVPSPGLIGNEIVVRVKGKRYYGAGSGKTEYISGAAVKAGRTITRNRRGETKRSG